jgi:hypothetical protein
MQRFWVQSAVKFLMFAAVAIVVLGFVVRALWNWLMPPLFGLHMLNFEQAWGLLALSWILFGGLRGGRGRHWRHRFTERWEKMTPEDREKARACLQNLGGPFGSQPGAQAAKQND